MNDLEQSPVADGDTQGYTQVWGFEKWQVPAGLTGTCQKFKNSFW